MKLLYGLHVLGTVFATSTPLGKEKIPASLIKEILPLWPSFNPSASFNPRLSHSSIFKRSLFRDFTVYSFFSIPISSRFKAIFRCNVRQEVTDFYFQNPVRDMK